MRELLQSLTLSVVVLAGLSSPLYAEEAWEQLLRLQLEDKEKCVLSGTLYVRKMETAGGTVYSGRAKCFDGRLFDFSQDKPHKSFDIRACEPMVC